MRRCFADLDRHFELLVIGGGIYGAWTAYDAALRGLSVAVIERSDWASATSSSSSKLIHGGLRYLEYGDVSLVAKALRERGRLLRLAPHRVQHQRFLLPLYPGGRAGRAALAAGLMLYDRLAGARPAAPMHAYVTADELHWRAPYLDRTGLRGGFAYSDAGEDDARMVLELISGAISAGAVALNYVEAHALLRAGNTVAGATVRDRMANATIDVHATITVDAGGPWVGRLLDGTRPPLRHTKGVHLVLPPLPHREALLLTTPRDQRVFFCIPWYGMTLVGTTDTDHHGEPATARVDDADVAYLLDAVRSRCPGLGWNADDIRGRFCGVRTLQAHHGRHASAVTREWELVEPAPGLLASLGGKYTSARVEAAHIVDAVCRRLGRDVACVTAHRPFPWAPRAAYSTWLHDHTISGRLAGLDAATAQRCAERFGTGVMAIHRHCTADPTLAERIVPAHAFCVAEALHAVSDEMALSLTDILRRRIPLAILGGLTRARISRIADLVAPLLGWTNAQREQEITAVETLCG